MLHFHKGPAEGYTSGKIEMVGVKACHLAGFKPTTSRLQPLRKFTKRSLTSGPTVSIRIAFWFVQALVRHWKSGFVNKSLATMRFFNYSFLLGRMCFSKPRKWCPREFCQKVSMARGRIKRLHSRSTMLMFCSQKDVSSLIWLHYSIQRVYALSFLLPNYPSLIFVGCCTKCWLTNGIIRLNWPIWGPIKSKLAKQCPDNRLG